MEIVMFEIEIWKNTRPQFIIEALPARRLLSVDIALDLVDDATCVELLPAGDFVDDQSLAEPVSDWTDEIADGEEFIYTMLETGFEDGGELMYYTMLETEVIDLAVDEHWTDDGEVIYTMLENEVAVDGEVPEEWLYMTGGVDGEPLVNLEDMIDGEVVILTGSPDEVLQVETPNTDAALAPPPAKAALFARADARFAVASGVFGRGDQDLLVSPDRVLV
jgi:hypothetical protein